MENVPKYVVIAEEREFILETYIELFESIEQLSKHIIISGTSGKQIIDKLEAEQVNMENISLFITDYSMQEMNGVELVKAVRKKGYTGKVIINSGYTIEETDIEKELSNYIFLPKGQKSKLDPLIELEAIIQSVL